MPGQSLPSSLNPPCSGIRTQAFERCKEVESSLVSRLAGVDVETGVTETRKVEEELMDLRVASYLLFHAPSDVGKEWAASCIMSAVDSEQVIKFGEFIRKHYIRCFKRKRGCTPSISRCSSRPETQSALLANPGRAPQSHTEARTKALFRDNYRCILSGTPDLDSFVDMCMDEARAEETHCAHIFDESTNDISSAKVVIDKKEYAANVWTIMRCMGYPHILDELKGVSVHRLGNIMTLTGSLHRMFDDLSICLDATGNPNEYIVTPASPRFARALAAVGCPTKVTLSNIRGLEPPSPTYLAIHAACHRIAHLSGAAEWYTRLDREGDVGCNHTTVADSDEDMFATVLADRLERLPGVEYDF
ncbi:hypothetical protein CYLTODRAFT_401865 [Cylindrobasidium torrendii FP15055 ss-10]|uniref:HNH nuclease domain-containing protein n=1 Tax=Cylindrobasidium torrendii FP15055 ss-10 TaxID=1314674 RepID=A0A0D7B2P2_9AGAR|nr:hypothetical protein CYLTODRAFT_401865 [Cylindrobasidium torrendii FP15055 ss-10]